MLAPNLYIQEKITQEGHHSWSSTDLQWSLWTLCLTCLLVFLSSEGTGSGLTQETSGGRSWRARRPVPVRGAQPTRGAASS